MDFQSPSESFFSFISSNINEDPKSLRLKEYGKRHDFDNDFAIIQIESRRKAMHKLKGFISNPLVLFPTTLAFEQSSHESVALYHASLVDKTSNVLDMTAGLGIDAMAFATRGCNVTACELDSLKAEVLGYNAGILGLDNLHAVNADSIEYLRSIEQNFGIIFIDPARRSDTDRRLYNFHDCTPDFLAIKGELLQRCRRLLIKASPLLDITRTLKDIPEAKSISAVSVGGECKEILVEADPNGGLQEITAIDLSQNGETNYRFSYNPNTPAFVSKPTLAAEKDITKGAYLYEPGAAVMKLAPWDAISSQFPKLKKFGLSSHLFVSPAFYDDFPGRILQVDSIIDKKSRKSLKGFPANVVSRNYPLKAEELRKKLGISEGLDNFIYATRLGDSPVLISAKRIRI